jgi:PhnB protein
MTMATPAAPVRPIPEGYHTVTPCLSVRGAAEAIEFYARAFGAVELFRMAAPDGETVWHAEIQIGDSKIMLGDELPEMSENRAPTTLGAATGALHLYVEDTDAAFARAIAAGATVSMPPSDMFWGDRYAKVIDPFGHVWGLATHQEDVSEEEMARRVQAAGGEASS